ncbi:WAT1-related protein At1g43650-like [Cornus florida]|uniref:WAT1-related protein At1g43650-like n=1 Tax=Cornus florida TaxID=4283 RepID=UPI002896FF9E|nr:WAT1-related protein At1g43650-like [Cornus florida]
MNCYRTLKLTVTKYGAFLGLVFIQTSYAGMILISKDALNDGMNPLVFVAYRQAIASFILAPFAFAFERKQCASLTFPIFCKIFLLALCGPTASLDFYFTGLRFSSATVASAIFNTTPIITFIISIFLRMEPVGWSSIYGGLKISGVVIAVGGAMVISFYQGPLLTHPNWHGHKERSTRTFSNNKLTSSTMNLIEGPILIILAAIAWSLWLIMQSKVLKVYPAQLRLSTLQCILSSAQSTVAAAAFARNLNSWRMGWNIQLASLAYSGVLVTGVTYWLQIWCIEKKGPFYVAMFTPLQLVITAAFSVIVWSEPFYFGSLLGGILIVGGLYCVLWGKRREGKQLMLKSEPPEVKAHDVERRC